MSTTATHDTIRLSCTCGKTARVPARYAGRRVRCSRCSQQLRVPGAKQDDLRIARTPAARPTSVARQETRRAKPVRAESTNPYAPPAARMDVRRPLDRNANRDLRAEAHIQALGVWSRIYGVFILIGALFFGVASISQGGLAFLFAALFAGLGAFCVWHGTSLMRYRNWARWLTSVGAGLAVLKALAAAGLDPSGASFLGLLIGGAWNGAILWALHGTAGARVFSPGYRSDATGVRWWTSPFFWIPAAFLAIGLLMILGGGALLLGR